MYPSGFLNLICKQVGTVFRDIKCLAQLFSYLQIHRSPVNTKKSPKWLHILMLWKVKTNMGTQLLGCPSNPNTSVSLKQKTNGFGLVRQSSESVVRKMNESVAQKWLPRLQLRREARRASPLLNRKWAFRSKSLRLVEFVCPNLETFPVEAVHRNADRLNTWTIENLKQRKWLSSSSNVGLYL